MITDGLEFTGKVAIVTGGATGIGYATAMQFARLGADTVIASRTVEELEAAAARIAEASGNFLMSKMYEMASNLFPDWRLYEYMFRHPELLDQSLRREYDELIE